MFWMQCLEIIYMFLILQPFLKDRVKDAQSASDTGKAREKRSSSSSTTAGFILGKPQPSLVSIPEADVPLSPGQHPESEMHLFL